MPKLSTIKKVPSKGVNLTKKKTLPPLTSKIANIVKIKLNISYKASNLGAKVIELSNIASTINIASTTKYKVIKVNFINNKAKFKKLLKWEPYRVNINFKL
jgi:hypothetical protein